MPGPWRLIWRARARSLSRPATVSLRRRWPLNRGRAVAAAARTSSPCATSIQGACSVLLLGLMRLLLLSPLLIAAEVVNDQLLRRLGRLHAGVGVRQPWDAAGDDGNASGGAEMTCCPSWTGWKQGIRYPKGYGA